MPALNHVQMFNRFMLLLMFLTTPVKASQTSNYSKTKHPIVMVPGAFGFDNILGGIDYWYGITDELRNGGAEVYVTNLSSSADNIQRGEELLGDVRNILALTGASKVNLIAHSQGATASRYVAALKPDWIESISCFNCMNEGTAFADNILSFFNQHKLPKFIFNTAISAIFTALELITSIPKDGDYNSRGRGIQIAEDLAIAAGRDSFQNFNQLFPEALSPRTCAMQGNGKTYDAIGGQPKVNGIYYYSVGGSQVKTHNRDPIDTVVVPIIQLFYPDDQVWDGFVPSCGHPLGEMIESNYAINHFDAINHTMGLVKAGVNVPSIYSMQVNRLRNEGH